METLSTQETWTLKRNGAITVGDVLEAFFGDPKRSKRSYHRKTFLRDRFFKNVQNATATVTVIVFCKNALEINGVVY